MNQEKPGAENYTPQNELDAQTAYEQAQELAEKANISSQDVAMYTQKKTDELLTSDVYESKVTAVPMTLSKVAALERELIKDGTGTLARMMYLGTEIAPTIEWAKDISIVTDSIAKDIIGKPLASALALNLASSKEMQNVMTALTEDDKFRKKLQSDGIRIPEIETDSRGNFIAPVTKRQLADWNRFMNQYIQKYGGEQLFGKRAGYATRNHIHQRRIMAALRRNGMPHELTEDFMYIANQLTRQQQLTQSISKWKKIQRLGFGKIKRYASQDDTGKGIFIYLSFWKHITNAVKSTLRTINNLRHGATILLRKAANTDLAHIIEKKRADWLEKKINRKNLKKPGSGNEYNTKRNAKKQAKKKRKRKRDNRRRKRNSFRQRIKYLLRRINPLARIQDAIAQAIMRRLANTILAKVAAQIAQVITTIISAISFVISSILIFVLLALLVIIIIITVTSGFDFSSADEEKRDYALQVISDLYSDQITDIYQLSASYDNCTIKYEDLKTKEKYDTAEADGTSSTKIQETTNSMEMASMLQVYFDYDLSDVKKSDIKKYLTELYDNSHQKYVDVETIPAQYDEAGNLIVAETTNATITLKTLYFDYIFDSADIAHSGVTYIYDTSELNLLASLIAAEGGASSEEGMMAVATSVMNRIESGRYPNTLKEVAYAPNQYEVTWNGGSFDDYIRNGAPDLALEVAQRALDGERDSRLMVKQGSTHDNCCSFYTDQPQYRNKYPNGISIAGNWFHWYW